MAKQEEYRQELEAAARDMQYLEGRLEEAEEAAATAAAAAATAVAAKTQPSDAADPVTETGPDREEEAAPAVSTSLGVKLPGAGSGPIKLRPNVHYYPAVPAPGAKDSNGQVGGNYSDETALYPPPEDSPPTSPVVSGRSAELPAPSLSLDDSPIGNKASSKPPLSPKPKAAFGDSRRAAASAGVSSAPRKRKSEYVLLEVNISDGQQRSLRIDAETQPLVKSDLFFYVLYSRGVSLRVLL